MRTPEPPLVNRVGASITACNFGWHHAGRENPSVQGLTLDIAAGEKVMLLGPSGSGKSTFLHAVAGTLHDDDGQSALGELLVNGKHPHSALGTVGLMQQDPESAVILARVGDDVAFGAENMQVSRDEIWQRVPAALTAVGLEDLDFNHSTSALSGGQKQRLGLAGILAMNPCALLLDEPTANLDPNGVLEVRDAVLAAREATGATLVVVEHRVEVWAQYMDRVVVLDAAGGISHDGTPEQVLQDARDELIASGVWVPGYDPAQEVTVALPQVDANAPVLIEASNLSVTRAEPKRAARKDRRQQVRASAPQELILDLPAISSGINCTVRAGEHLAIMGANGAGKSTLALTLAGLQLPVAGLLAASDELRAGASWDIASWSGQELVQRIGMVFQEPEHQFLTPSVRAELEYGPRQVARAQKKSLDEEQLTATVDALLQRLRLSHLAEANPFTLSGGEKRRLSVATALAAAPRVLILDEPTFGQDARTWAQLLELIRELLATGVAVVSVTHDEEFVRALGSRVLKVVKNEY
ncbi:ABC transporter ATP-binding protein [Rothia sp. ZJ1223]|nr:ABC transporter ATP-binding protein [Rothia sp. ZJ1223]